MPHLVWRVEEKRVNPYTGEPETVSTTDHRDARAGLADARKRALDIHVWIDQVTGEHRPPPEYIDPPCGRYVYATEMHFFHLRPVKSSTPAPLRS